MLISWKPFLCSEKKVQKWIFFLVTPGGNYFQKTQTLFSDFQCVETEKSFWKNGAGFCFTCIILYLMGAFGKQGACLDICPVTGSFISHPASPFPSYFLALVSVFFFFSFFFCLLICISWCLTELWSPFWSCSFFKLQYANGFFLPVSWHWNCHLLIFCLLQPCTCIACRSVYQDF